MKATFNAECGLCETFKPQCAKVTVRGTNMWGNRFVKRMPLCEDCMRKWRNLYRLRPKHKGRRGTSS